LDATRAVETIEHGGRRGFDGLKEKQGRRRPEPGGVVGQHAGWTRAGVRSMVLHETRAGLGVCGWCRRQPRQRTSGGACFFRTSPAGDRCRPPAHRRFSLLARKFRRPARPKEKLLFHLHRTPSLVLGCR